MKDTLSRSMRSMRAGGRNNYCDYKSVEPSLRQHTYEPLLSVLKFVAAHLM